MAKDESLERKIAQLEYSMGPELIRLMNTDSVFEVIANPDGKIWADTFNKGRVDTGIVLEPGQIRQIIYDVAALNDSVISDAFPLLEAEIPEKKIMFRFDKKQLKRVFENLITNSFRHNEKGTLIYAEMLEGDDNITIRIGDNGKGIPQEIRDSIFEPFVVGNKSRTGAKGSGLGLAISKKIVESHNGTIALIEDSEGRLRTLYEIILKK